MSKHTPGPWFSDDKGNIWRRDPAELYQNGGAVAGDHPIATVFRGHPSWEIGFPVEDNARLMRAAPDLLACAEQMMEWWEDAKYMTTGERGDYNVFDGEPDFITSARAAIAKAKGEA